MKVNAEVRLIRIFHNYLQFKHVAWSVVVGLLTLCSSSKLC